jgi:hypothetical protein
VPVLFFRHVLWVYQLQCLSVSRGSSGRSRNVLQQR